MKNFNWFTALAMVLCVLLSTVTVALAKDTVVATKAAVAVAASCFEKELECRAECAEDFTKSQDEVDECIETCKDAYETCLKSE